VARRRYQTGCLFKRGKRRKVWVARWREDVLLEGGQLGRLHRSVVLGTVADLPTKREALTKLEGYLRPVNLGAGRPEASLRFGAFVESQWSALVLPTLKLSTQHGYKHVLAKHVLPYWRDWQLRDIGKLDVQQYVADKFRQHTGWQTVRNAWTLLSGILETAVEYGYLTLNPARGVKFPQKKLSEAPAIIAGDDFTKLLNEVDEPYRMMIGLIAATGIADRRAAGTALARARSGSRDTPRARVGVRGQDAATENAEGAAHDSARASCDWTAEGASQSGDAQER
jgi:hypothetical protein